MINLEIKNKTTCHIRCTEFYRSSGDLHFYMLFVIYIICMQHCIDRISLLVTYSRYLVHGAGSDMAMKIQLVSMVNIMKRLKNLEEKNVLRKMSVIWCVAGDTFKYNNKSTATMFRIILWNVSIWLNPLSLRDNSIKTTGYAD